MCRVQVNTDITCLNKEPIRNHEFYGKDFIEINFNF